MTTATANETHSVPRINDVAPDFTADTTQGTIHFHEWTSVSDDDARKKYPQGFKTHKPYLRTVQQPK